MDIARYDLFITRAQEALDLALQDQRVCTVSNRRIRPHVPTPEMDYPAVPS